MQEESLFEWTREGIGNVQLAVSVYDDGGSGTVIRPERMTVRRADAFMHQPGWYRR